MTGERSRARGELEADVMRILWDSDAPLNAKEIQDVFPGKTPAYTTILTTLERLRAKGDVVRVGAALRGVQFAAARTESEHTGQAMLDRLADSSDRSAALLKFAGSLDRRDVELLRRALEPGGSRRATS